MRAIDIMIAILSLEIVALIVHGWACYRAKKASVLLEANHKVLLEDD